MITSKEIIKAVGEALLMFGTYTFGDKGPSEVMDMDGISSSLRAMPAADAAAVLRELAASKKRSQYCQSAAEVLTQYLDDWDDLFKEPGIDDIYNGEFK